MPNMVNMTKTELRFLIHLVMKLERNRHFIGDAFSIGSLCMVFRSGLENPKIHASLMRDIPDGENSLSDQLLELLLKAEQ